MSTSPPLLSVIVPVLNEAAAIESTLRSILRVAGEKEVIVVDGGSRDGTCDKVRTLPVRLLEAPAGRGAQLAAGAAAARGDLLWFVHADTLVPADACAQMRAAVRDLTCAGGNFTIRFDSPGREAEFLGWVYPKLRKAGLMYGDSALFVRRDAYELAGGFRPLPLFEDLDLLSRLRPYGEMALLPATVISSSRRFAGRRFLPAAIQWTSLQMLYWLHVDPRLLARWYAPVRTPPGRFRSPSAVE